MKPFSHRRRPVHLGPYPSERLPRLDAVDALPPGSDSEPLPPRPTEAESPGPTSAAHAYELYRDLFNGQRHGEVAPEAPTPAETKLRAPCMNGGFALSVVSTDWKLAPDRPLARRGLLAALRSTRGPG